MTRSACSFARLLGFVWIQRATVVAVLVFGLAGEALANDPPSLSFTARPLDGPNNLWEFSGQVQDEFVQGCTVEIDGGNMFETVTVAVNPDGSFSYTVSIPQGGSGWVYAVAKDQQGLKSNEKKEFVG